MKMTKVAKVAKDYDAGLLSDGWPSSWIIEQKASFSRR
jgi:hypothetical protein